MGEKGAMDAGYAEGRTSAERAAVRRIMELEAKVKELSAQVALDMDDYKRATATISEQSREIKRLGAELVDAVVELTVESNDGERGR